MTDLDFEHPSTGQAISKNLLTIDENEESVVIEEEMKTLNRFILKKLPKNLQYAFLSENGNKPMIISSDLSKEMEAKLLEVLKRNVNAFAWSIEDIKGIIPSICMHKILMEEDYTPTFEHQKRLNPAMKEVVNKEVLKWLHARFIYAISDSPWVK